MSESNTPPHTDRALILFVRNPELGQVKTRLAAGIGEEQALTVYRHLLERTRQVAEAVQADRFVFYSDMVDHKDGFLDHSFKKYVQCHGDLGTRMDFAFSIPFKTGGYKRVQIVGSDIPDLTPEIIEAGFDALGEHDHTLGPASDGGYYLLGMTRWQRELFKDMPWSSNQVLAETRKRIEAEGRSVHMLPELQDIDTEADWVAAGRPGAD